MATLILFAGFTAFQESFDKMLHPEAVDYSAISLVIIAAASAVKLAFGRYSKAAGKIQVGGSGCLWHGFGDGRFYFPLHAGGGSQYDPEILQMHGFYVDTERMLVSFDLIVDFQAEDVEGYGMIS